MVARSFKGTAVVTLSACNALKFKVYEQSKEEKQMSYSKAVNYLLETKEADSIFAETDANLLSVAHLLNQWLSESAK